MTTELYLGDESKLRMPNRFGRQNIPALHLAHATQASQTMADGEELRQVPLTAVAGQSPLQVRAAFDPDADTEDRALAESLKADGQRVPVLLVEAGSDSASQYTPLDGHRRIAALRYLGHPTVKAVIVRAGTLDCDLISLTANVRKNLTPVELAHAVDRLENQHGLEPDDIAQRVGLARSYVWQLRRLTKTPNVLAAVQENRITANVAYAILKAPEDLQQKVLELAEKGQLSEPQVSRVLAESKKHNLPLVEAANRLHIVLPITEPAQTTDPASASAQTDAVEPGSQGSARPAAQPEMTRDDIVAFVREICPDVTAEQAGDVADLALDHAQPRKVVKAACLLVLSNWEPVNAIEGAELSSRDPLVRLVVAMLDLCLELEGLVRRGGRSRECAPMLVGLMKRLASTKRITLQLDKE